jgi:Flp pilus assembly secretin CpaC
LSQLSEHIFVPAPGEEAPADKLTAHDGIPDSVAAPTQDAPQAGNPPLARSAPEGIPEAFAHEFPDELPAQREPAEDDVAEANNDGAPRETPRATDTPPTMQTLTTSADQRLRVEERESRLMRTQFDVVRAESLDPRVCDVIQFAPREVAVIGKERGMTRVLMWQKGNPGEPISYTVTIGSDDDEQGRVLDQYSKLHTVIQEMYPNSDVTLRPDSGRLIVSGTVESSEDAIAVITMIRRMRTIPVVDQLKTVQR